MESKTQDPDDKLDYLIDWRSGNKPFLADDEVITESSWVAYTTGWEPTDELTLSSDSHTDTTATVFVAGGTVGTKYYLTNHIVTAAGREKDLSIKLTIKEQ